MFSSFFSAAPADPYAQNIHPVSSAYKPNELAGELQPEDLQWLCSSSFIAETQTFYNILEDGTFLMLQVIHSGTGLWYPTIQFTCKLYNPTTKEITWRSLSVTNFVTPYPGRDKRSCRADQFTVLHSATPNDATTAESFDINVTLSEDLQISFKVSRPKSVRGFKVGNGPKGGYSYFGPDPNNAEGYVVHRFWPFTTGEGFITRKGTAQAIKAAGGMFVHAIQGMRPNLVASRWNFSFFTSLNHGGVSAINMEFITLDTHGKKGAGSGGTTITVGSIVAGGKLAAVTAETRWKGDENIVAGDVQSRAVNYNTSVDPETGYDVPGKYGFYWAGPSVVPEAPGNVKAELELDLSPEGKAQLIEKVDFLGELPTVLKSVVHMTGTKPYIYQWIAPATLKITAPKGVVGNDTEAGDVEGTVYCEASFLSAAS